MLFHLIYKETTRLQQKNYEINTQNKGIILCTRSVFLLKTYKNKINSRLIKLLHNKSLL